MARIFLLEDDPEIREAVAEYLRLADHEVTECERGDEAARLISSTVPDLLILDVAVPGRSGFVVAKDARATGDVPIIFLTSRDDETSRITGLELGADDYVTKPFSPRELVLRVNAVLRRTTSAAGQPPSRAAVPARALHSSGHLRPHPRVPPGKPRGCHRWRPGRDYRHGVAYSRTPHLPRSRGRHPRGSRLRRRGGDAQRRRPRQEPAGAPWRRALDRDGPRIRLPLRGDGGTMRLTR